jgi:WD40 repeat protein
MFRSPFLALLALALSGCLSIPVGSDPAAVEPVADLVTARTPHPLDESAGISSISEDGNTFLAWLEDNGVVLLRTSDYSIIEKFYERDRSQLRYERDTGTPTGYIQGAGFFDNNTWYFGVVPNDKNEKGERRTVERIDIHIRSIHPPHEIAKYSFPWWNQDQLVANKDHFAIISDKLIEKFKAEGILVDWRTGKHYPLNMPSHLFKSVFIGVIKYPNIIKLTDSSRILAENFDGKKNQWYLFDPLNSQKELLERHLFLSPDERYGIDFGVGRCKLRKFPGRKVAPLNDKQIIGYCSGSLPKKDAWEYPVAFSGDGKFFVIAVKDSFRVYRMEPFQLELEGKAHGDIQAVKFSENGLLATSDEKGFIRVWDVMNKQIIGQRKFHLPGNEEKPYPPAVMLFHPDGDRLFVAYHYLEAFQLPKRGAD